jgi:hypothetical protein
MVVAILDHGLFQPFCKIHDCSRRVFGSVSVFLESLTVWMAPPAAINFIKKSLFFLRFRPGEEVVTTLAVAFTCRQCAAEACAVPCANSRPLARNVPSRSGSADNVRGSPFYPRTDQHNGCDQGTGSAASQECAIMFLSPKFRPLRQCESHSQPGGYFSSSADRRWSSHAFRCRNTHPDL